MPQPVPELELSCSFDLPNQRVVRNDADRTRNDLLLTREKYALELLLTFYCKHTQTPYRQGLNEVLAPFVMLGRQGLSLSEIYWCFHNFVRTCLPTMFIDEEFRTLQALMALFKLLLRYTDPELSKFLEDFGFGPELYASPWFLTMFASKIEDINIVCSLWDTLLVQRDPLFPLFVATALITAHRTKLLKTPQSRLPQTLAALTIPTARHLTKVLVLAADLKLNLPYSVYIQLTRYPLTRLNELSQLLVQLEQMQCLVTLPREIVMRAFPFKCHCELNSCQWCKASCAPVELLVLDCRLSEEREGGVVPMSVPCNLADDQFVNQIKAAKGVSHIALLGSPGLLKDSWKVVQAVYLSLYNLGVPFVSIVSGGFKDCHDLALSFHLSLVGHDEDRCLACTPTALDAASGLKRQVREVRKSVFGKMKQVFDRAGDALSKSTGASSAVSESHVSSFDLDLADPYTRSYNCRKMTRSSRALLEDNYQLIVTLKEVALCKFSGQTWYVFDKAEIKDLIKITAQRQLPNSLTFYFKGASETEHKNTYVLESSEDTKACIQLVSSYFNALVPHSYAGTAQN